MPLYCYVCSKCGHKFEYLECMARRNELQVCPGCGGPSGRDVESEAHGNSDTVAQDHIRYSKAMGVNPEQIPSAEKAFPGSEYVKSGPHAGDLIIRNRQHKLKEMKRRGFDEYN